MASRDVRFRMTTENRTERGFDRVDKRLRGVAASARNVGRAFGAVAIAGGLVLLGRKVSGILDDMDAITKRARDLDVSPGAVARFDNIGELIGVGGEKFDKFIDRLRVGAVDAEAGGKKTAAAFAALGLEVAKFQQLPGDEQLLVTIGQIEQIGNESEKSAVAAALLGNRLGKDLVRLSKTGEAALRELVEEQKALGTGFSEGAGNAAEEVKDAFTRVRQAIGNNTRKSIEEFLPRADMVRDEGKRLSRAIADEGFFKGTFERFRAGFVAPVITSFEQIEAASSGSFDAAAQAAERSAAAVRKNLPAGLFKAPTAFVDALENGADAAERIAKAAKEQRESARKAFNDTFDTISQVVDFERRRRQRFGSIDTTEQNFAPTILSARQAALEALQEFAEAQKQTQLLRRLVQLAEGETPDVVFS